MKILFGAYRDWAIESINDCNLDDHESHLCQEPNEFNQRALSESWDAIIVIGWSWKIPAPIVNTRLVVGMHPSDLPMYAGGSPIQNQILDGLTETKATLFKLNEKFDEGEIVDKEPISLRGHLQDVLDSISSSTSILIDRFVSQFPDNTFTKQSGKSKQVRRLKPEHSKLPLPAETVLGEWDTEFVKPDDVVTKKYTCKEMWNFIRCREDPYPNAYFEDETGRLVIKVVEFEEKNNSGS